MHLGIVADMNHARVDPAGSVADWPRNANGAERVAQCGVARGVHNDFRHGQFLPFEYCGRFRDEPWHVTCARLVNAQHALHVRASARDPRNFGQFFALLNERFLVAFQTVVLGEQRAHPLNVARRGAIGDARAYVLDHRPRFQIHHARHGLAPELVEQCAALVVFAIEPGGETLARLRHVVTARSSRLEYESNRSATRRNASCVTSPITSLARSASESDSFRNAFTSSPTSGRFTLMMCAPASWPLAGFAVAVAAHQRTR
jgi:hypothetical protein